VCETENWILTLLKIKENKSLVAENDIPIPS
jgi:hypothetical protein